MSDTPVAPGIVIVGAGQAGLQAAESLRSGGYQGSITLIGEEPHGPYHRPPLSKAWLAGEIEANQLVMRAPELLARKGIDLRTDTRVAAIDRGAQLVQLADGSALPYVGLVLATGSSPRMLTLPGSNAANVLALRSREHGAAISDAFVHCRAHDLPVVVIGGGFIGLEVAATARKLGLAVTVLEAAPRLLARALTPRLSEWFADLHRGRDVQLVLGANIVSIETEGGYATAVLTADGTRYPTGLVVVGIGVAANDRLARVAGLECDRGIVVDDCARTSDPLITAAGDCTARRVEEGALLRLESVNNATEQAKSAAAALLGQPRPFTGTPWFWSDQFGWKLQMTGLAAGTDQVVLRGDMQGESFSLYHFQGEKLLSVDSLNAARDHLTARKLLDAGLSPTPAQAADTSFDLASLVAKK